MQHQALIGLCDTLEGFAVYLVCKNMPNNILKPSTTDITPIPDIKFVLLTASNALHPDLLSIFLPPPIQIFFYSMAPCVSLLPCHLHSNTRL
jgi:hypothetical protein